MHLEWQSLANVLIAHLQHIKSREIWENKFCPNQDDKVRYLHQLREQYKNSRTDLGEENEGHIEFKVQTVQTTQL